MYLGVPTNITIDDLLCRIKDNLICKKIFS